MPQQAWSKKRERQYKHIKSGLKKSGRSEDAAEEIAARTVNKERARSGEARTSSRLSRRTSRPDAAAAVAFAPAGRVAGRAISSTKKRRT